MTDLDHNSTPPEGLLVHCLQHSDRVCPLSIATWAADRGVELHVVRVDLEPLPDPQQVERLVVLGGGMNTDELADNPWLDAERTFLRTVLDGGRTRVLGICLGSQLLAEVLGGSVRRSATPEIGWQRVRLTEAGRRTHAFSGLSNSFEVFEWHGDEWTLPETGAVLAVTSDGCPSQAFTAGDLITGVQFHAEFTHERTTELAATSTDDFTRGGWVQHPEEFLSEPERFEDLRRVCDSILDRTMLDPLPTPPHGVTAS